MSTPLSETLAELEAKATGAPWIWGDIEPPANRDGWSFAVGLYGMGHTRTGKPRTDCVLTGAANHDGTGDIAIVNRADADLMVLLRNHTAVIVAALRVAEALDSGAPFTMQEYRAARDGTRPAQETRK